MGTLAIIVDEHVDVLGEMIKEIIRTRKECLMGRVIKGARSYELEHVQEIPFASLDAVLVPSYLDNSDGPGISATIRGICSAPIIGYGPLPPKNGHYAFFLNTQRLMDPNDQEHRLQFLKYLDHIGQGETKEG